MKIHELTIQSVKDKKRVGRGIGSGYGKTAGRGTKGQNSRTGGGVRPGFEGGQNPLSKRLPKKRGFAALNPTIYRTVNLNQLETLKVGTVVTIESLVEAGLIRNANIAVKVLGTGKLSKKLQVKLQAATQTAATEIANAGGSFEQTAIAPSPKKPSKRNQKR